MKYLLLILGLFMAWMPLMQCQQHACCQDDSVIMVETSDHNESHKCCSVPSDNQDTQEENDRDDNKQCQCCATIVVMYLSDISTFIAPYIFSSEKLFDNPIYESRVEFSIWIPPNSRV